MSVRITLNRRGVRELLRSAEVGRDLERRGRSIAAAAGPGNEVQSWRGRNRMRITVRTDTAEARRAEATTRALTRAVNAGRRR